MNFISAHCHKTIGYASQHVAAPAAGAAGTIGMWQFHWHMGHSVKNIVFDMLLAQADNAAAADPYVAWHVHNPVGGAIVDTTPKARNPVIDASTSDTPDTYNRIVVKLPVDGTLSDDTDYAIDCHAVDYARPVSCLIYEEGENPVNDATTGCVDPRISALDPILDDRMEDLMKGTSEIWGTNAGPILCWSADNAAGVLSVVNQASYINAWNPAFGTTIDDTVACNKILLSYHNTAVQATVPVTMAVYAERTVGAGTCTVRYTNGTDTLTTGAITTAGWYTVTGTLPAAALDHYTVHAQTGAATTLEIWSVCVYEYQ
jgi:hypothetical protein